MVRLTKWNGKKWVLPQGQWREIAERLAAYENTGLEPEQIIELKSEEALDLLMDGDKPSRYDFFTASIIVKDHEGNVPYVDPVTCNAYLYFRDIKTNADNYEVVQREPGVNHLLITVYRDHWHISQVSGYTLDRGIYTKLF